MLTFKLRMRQNPFGSPPDSLAGCRPRKRETGEKEKGERGQRTGGKGRGIGARREEGGREGRWEGKEHMPCLRLSSGYAPA